MAERHFQCTACGKCCHGWVPLTLCDAMANAGLFPLAMVWTVVRQASTAFDLVSRLGATIVLPNRKKAAALIAPTVYIPREQACPALTADNLCAIHERKPQRCRTMPFYPYRAEADQDELLVPRKDWLCDVSEAAPVVYRDGVILDRADFDSERAALLAQAQVLGAYADKSLKHNPGLMDSIVTATQNPNGGNFVTSVFSFLKLNPTYDLAGFAKAQHPVLLACERALAAENKEPDYRKYYASAAGELAWFAQDRT